VDATVWKTVYAERCTYRLGRGRGKRAGVRYHLKRFQTGQHISQYLASCLLYFLENDEFFERMCQVASTAAVTPQCLVEPVHRLPPYGRQPLRLFLFLQRIDQHRTNRNYDASAWVKLHASYSRHGGIKYPAVASTRVEGAMIDNKKRIPIWYP